MSIDELSVQQDELPSLKSIREEKGISLDEIVSQTRFSLSKLELLEQKRYDAVGVEAFVVAYIQRYAKIVGFDPTDYIAEYRKTFISNDELAAEAPSESTASESRSKHSNSPISTQLIVIVVMGSLVLWLLAAALIPVNDEKAIIVGSELSINPPTVENVNKKREAPVQKEKQKVITSTELEGAKPVNVENIRLPESAQEKSVNSTPVADLPATTSRNNEPSFVERTLDFSFSDDCWVEVSDRNNKVIIAELRRKGDNLQLLGEAPLTVMLGNARAANLMVDGELFPIEPKGRRRTLKFVVTP